MTWFRHWQQQLSYQDPIQRQQAIVLQQFLVLLLAMVLLMIPVIFLAPIQITAVLILLVGLVGIAATFGSALWLLRRGRLMFAVGITTISITVFLLLAILSTGLNTSGLSLFGLSLPLTIAALVSGRQAVWRVFGVSMFGLIAVALVELIAPQYTGFARPQDVNIVGIVVTYLIIGSVFVVMLSLFTTMLYQAIESSRQREQDLEQLRAMLEQTVHERTSELQNTLETLEQQSAAQQALLETTALQTSTIRQMSVPVIPLGKQRLIVPLIGLLDADRMQFVMERVLSAATSQSAQTLLLDISGVPFIEPDTARALVRVIEATALVGTQTRLIGVAPDVAQALVSSGVNMQQLVAFATLEQALTYG